MSTQTIEYAVIEASAPVVAARWKPAPPSPGQILTGAVDLMVARGRAYGTFELQSGEVCALAAMGLAAGKDADCWDGLSRVQPSGLGHGYGELIEAARLLVRVIAPWHDADALMVEDLIEIVGDWHDGPSREVAGRLTYPCSPLNSTVFEAFGKAAEMAAPAVAR